LATRRPAVATTRTRTGTARTVGSRKVQLAGEAAGVLVVLDAGHHRVRAAVLVLGTGTVVFGRTHRRTGRARRRSRRGRRSCRLGRSFLRRPLEAGLLGLALVFHALALGLFGLALARGFLGTLAVDLGKVLLLGEVALARLLKLAQHLGALVVHGAGRTGALRTLDVGALLPDLDSDGGLAAAAADGQFLHLAPGQGDLLWRSDFLGLRGPLAVGTAQEAKQLDLLGTGHDLVGTAELHAGLGQLLQQF